MQVNTENAPDFQSSPYFLLASYKQHYYRIQYAKLRFIETGTRDLVFHYENREITISGSLSDYERELPKQVFYRCNNSYIVNLHYIDEIIPDGSRYKLHLSTGESIPLSRNKFQECIQKIQDTRKDFT